MFRPRPHLLASAIITLCVTALGITAGDHPASAAGTLGHGWQPSSPRSQGTSTSITAPFSREPQASAPKAVPSTAPTAQPPAPPSKPAPRWKLPNTTNTNQSAPPNPLRKNEANAASQEPRPFQPASTTAPLHPPLARNNAAQVQHHSPSAASAPPAYTAPHAGSAAVASVPVNRPASHQQPHHSVAQVPHQSKSYTSQIWNTVQVAFQGPEQWTAEAENLPLPEATRRSTRRSQPTRRMSKTSEMPEAHKIHEGIVSESDVFTEHGEGMYMPYGEPGPHCSDGSCSSCPDGGCACGCGEAACSCEPGCACQSGESPCIVACGDDVCLVGEGDAEACHTIRIGVPKWQELMVFGGVHGFKGPYDQERDSGNFGFNEGFNAGFKVPFSGMGYQIGYRAAHSQLSGDKDTDISDPHTQQFITTAVFQRVKDGIQFGIAWDMLRDERFGAVDFHQLRGELSIIDHGCHELGINATVHLNEHEAFPADDETPSVVYQASDQYLLFYRIHGARGGEGRFYGGFNDDEDGIIGTDLLLPIKDRWSLQTGFTYLIPDEPVGEQGATQEAWNIGMALVWHWDCRARSCHNNCYRPMFNVADNGYLIVDERLGAPATDDD